MTQEIYKGEETMKLHELKIEKQYAIEKVGGRKMFEIRKNDRDFQVGDLIHYIVVDDETREDITSAKIKVGLPILEALDRFEFALKLYRITYITDYEQKDGYVVFGEEEVKVVKV